MTALTVVPPAFAEAGQAGDTDLVVVTDVSTVATLPLFANDGSVKPTAEPLDEGGCRWDVNDIRRQQVDLDRQQRRVDLPSADTPVGS